MKQNSNSAPSSFLERRFIPLFHKKWLYGNAVTIFLKCVVLKLTESKAHKNAHEFTQMAFATFPVVLKNSVRSNFLRWVFGVMKSTDALPSFFNSLKIMNYPTNFKEMEELFFAILHHITQTPLEIPSVSFTFLPSLNKLTISVK